MDREVSRRKFDAEVRSLKNETGPYISAKGWKIVASTYPILAVVLRHFRSTRQIEFRFNCDDWDELPPSLTLHDPKDGRELAWSQWPQGGWDVHDTHPSTRKPFLCLPGIREYHSHLSHLGTWEGYRQRGTHRLRDIIDRVQQRFEDTGG